ncbi:MAG: GTPase Era [Deltaproteobacteria bacterium]|nr:GTPase Era [Deltaproteobacteria bacterium]
MFKSGFIGIIGRPNVGKSTLLNAILGEKLAIATPKPQTTRNRILGIKTFEEGQLIFVDTPGIHRISTPLNRTMVEAALDTIRTVDVLLLLVDAGAGFHPGDGHIIDKLADTALPVLLVINKIDRVEKKTLLPLIDRFRHMYAFREILPVSAQRGDGVRIVIAELLGILPEGPRYFPEDMITDRSERFIASEIIREKITLLTHKEVPYAVAVVVEAFKEEEQRNLIRIAATIHVEKGSQKAILIGKGGAMLKEIGIQARKELERFFAAKIFLELFVRVQKDWTRNPRMLREFGYKS